MTQPRTGPSSAWTPDEATRRHCFRVTLFALFVAGSVVSFRAAIAALLRAEYFDATAPLTANAMIGSILGAPFAGFAVTLIVASSLLPAIGYRRALVIASACLASGLVAMIAAGGLAGGDALFWVLFAAAAVQGIGWGFVETTVNPLTSALFPDNRTHALSVLHAWYPAGVVAGALIGLNAGAALPWRAVTALFAAAAILFGVLAARAPFPPVRAGETVVTLRSMVGALKRQPTLILWLVVMMMTATSEFAPGQWVDIALSQIVGMRGVLLLAYVSGLMFVMRHFAGPLVHRLSNIGLLSVSAVLTAAGLFALAHATTPVTALLAATLWGCGVCYLWPTMLATVSERYPAGGPLVFGLLAASGAGSTYVTLPVLGGIYDRAKATAAATGADTQAILTYAARESFQAVALIPLALVPIFAAIYLLQRRRPAATPAATDASATLADRGG